MKKQRIFLAISAVLLLTITACQPSVDNHDQTEYIEVISIFEYEFPDYPPPPGGWTFQTTGPHPSEIQGVFALGDKMFLGVVISEKTRNEVKLSKISVFNKETGIEKEIAIPTSELGPFEPDGKYLIGLQNPWEVPRATGKYEVRLYIDNEIIASAIFMVE